MADIELFKTKGTIEKLPSKQVLLEREWQNLLEANMETFFGVTFLKSEYKIKDGRMDSIGIDENNCPVIFEYKRSMNENVISQGLFYLDWLLDHKADFQLLVQKVLGVEKSNEIDWSMPCVICIANDFTKYDLHAVNQMQRNIRLVRYRKFGDDLIAFEHLNAPQVQSEAAPEKLLPKEIVQEKIGRDYKSFKDSFEEADSNLQNLYYSIRDFCLALGDDISENTLALYVAFRKNKNIACVQMTRKQVQLYLRLDPDTVTLEKDFLEDVRNIGHQATGDLRVRISTTEEFEKVCPLIVRAYNEN